MKKRGQVTVFILVGIVILLVIGLFFFVMRNISVGNIFIPKEIVPIARYSEQCVQQVASDGIFLLGVQGGYIYYPKKILMEKSYLNLGYKIPYWFYNSEARIPTKSDMAAELDRYLRDNLAACLNNFDSLREQYDLSELKNFSTQTTLNSGTASVRLSIPMKIKIKGQETTMDFPELVIDIDTRLGEMADLASLIMRKENELAFLEVVTDDMIAVSPDIPYEGMEITCEPRVWKVDDMKSYIQNLVRYNIPYISFRQAETKDSGYAYYDQIYIDRNRGGYRIDLESKKFKNLKVETIYKPSWGMDIDVIPSKDGLVKPAEFEMDRFVFGCVKIYHHKYSLNFPVLFHIINTENPDEQFYFSTPVMTRRSEPNRYNEIKPWPVETDIFGSRRYCENTTEITLYGLDENNNIISKPGIKNNRKYGLNVYAVDTLTGKALSDVSISYQCVRFKCDLGKTALQFSPEGYLTGASPVLSSRFPECSGGLVYGEKDGYFKGWTQQTVDEHTTGSQVVVDMIPLRQFNYNVKVIQDHNDLIEERELALNESVLITLSNKEKNFERAVYYPPLEYLENLTLLNGQYTYELDIKLFKDEQIYGGLLLNWTPEFRHLLGTRTVQFYVYKRDPFTPVPSMMDNYQLYQYALNHSSQYAPVII